MRMGFIALDVSVSVRRLSESDSVLPSSALAMCYLFGKCR